jgi:hypothetical protein
MATLMKTQRALWLILPFCLGGCVVETSSPAPARGALIVDWAIGGVQDPDQCDLAHVEVIDIVVSRASGIRVDEYQQTCGAFLTRIELAPGFYYADAVLLDAAGNQRTTVIEFEPFEIFGGDELDIPIDFPASSFF